MIGIFAAYVREGTCKYCVTGALVVLLHAYRASYRPNI